MEEGRSESVALRNEEPAVGVAVNDEEYPSDEDTIDNGESEPAAEGGQMSVSGHSLATEDLPVAHEVESTVAQLPAPRRVRREQPQDPTIPHAIPEEQILAEERRDACHRVLFVLGCVLSLIVVVVVVFVVTFGGEGETTEPTPSHTTATFQELQELVTSVSFDNGTSLQDSNSPQYKALKWLEGNAKLDEYADWKRIQRYTLAAFYYATNGDDWCQKSGWLSDDNECTWYSRAQDYSTPLPVCDENGAYAVIRLEKTNMHGTLPPELALFSNSLYRLDLEYNLLIGTIPTELGLLTNLEGLDLDKNRFTGTIPTELSMIGRKNVSESGVVIRARENNFTGTIPTEILGIEGLGELNIGENKLTGSIPTEIGLASDLIQLGLYWNELTGTLPTELGQLSLLEYLLLYRNGLLNGTIPSEIGLLTNLAYFEANKHHKDSNANMISGTLPSELGLLTSLVSFQFEHNALQGTIPSEIGNMMNLVFLYLFWNRLTGTIPTEIGRMSSLASFALSSNPLTSTIPTEIGNCRELEDLSLRDNSLNGTFPIELTRLSNLKTLGLDRNNFTSSLPSEIGLLTNLCE